MNPTCRCGATCNLESRSSGVTIDKRDLHGRKRPWVTRPPFNVCTPQSGIARVKLYIRDMIEFSTQGSVLNGEVGRRARDSVRQEARQLMPRCAICDLVGEAGKRHPDRGAGKRIP